MAMCVHCGVDDCAATFHQCLVLDFTDPGYGLVHHLTVAAYMLQHNAYSDEMADTMARFVLRHLDEPPGEATKREIRRATDGGQRVTRREDAKPINPDGGWTHTVADVDLGSAAAYRATVRTWADAVARVLPSDTRSD